MIKLFDGVFLKFEWGFDPTQSCLVFSEKIASTQFLDNILSIKSLSDFFLKETSFKAYIEAHCNNDPIQFFDNLIKQSQDSSKKKIYIYADPESFNEILICYLKCLYSHNDNHQLFKKYAMMFDRLRIIRPFMAENEYFLSQSQFEGKATKWTGKKIPKELHLRLPVECWMGEVLSHPEAFFKATLMPKIIEEKIQLLGKQFLISREVIDFRRTLWSGIYDIDDNNFYVSLENPKLVSQSNFYNNFNQDFEIEKLENENLDQLLESHIKKYDKHNAFQFRTSPNIENLIQACKRKNAIDIIKSDYDLAWGSYLLNESALVNEHNTLMLGYVYALKRKERYDLLSEYRLPGLSNEN
jgi:hypothetical protein